MWLVLFLLHSMQHLNLLKKKLLSFRLMLAYKLVNLTILFVFDKVSLTIMGKGNKMVA